MDCIDPGGRFSLGNHRFCSSSLPIADSPTAFSSPEMFRSLTRCLLGRKLQANIRGSHACTTLIQRPIDPRLRADANYVKSGYYSKNARTHYTDCMNA
jgi:hypothetical protein